MNKRQVLFSMFYDLARTRTRDAFRAGDGSAAAIRAPGGPLWLWAHDDADQTSLFLFFDEALAHCGIPSPEVLIAEPRVAEACAGYHAAQTRCAYQTRGLIAYYLAVDITCNQGFLRPAAQGDGAFLMEWIEGFYAEALPAGLPDWPEHNPPKTFGSRYGRLYVFSDDPSSAPAAMGMLCGKGGTVRRLNLIYTPPALRRRGYGKGVTAALAKQACAEGGLPVLYTAEDNIPANRLYRSLGFAEAGRLSEVTFEKI